MRSPLDPLANEDVTVFNGNQFRGGRGAADQHQTGSTLFFKRAGDTSWNSTPLKFRLTRGNNKYFGGTIAADFLQSGETIEYYLRIAYAPNERQTTFLFGSDSQSRKSASEAEAQQSPYTLTVGTPADFVSFAAGELEARIMRESGRIQLVGPDLNGIQQAIAISLSPIVQIDDELTSLGRVHSTLAVGNGIELVQELGQGTATARLTFPHDGVMRYEVVDWNGIEADKTSISVASVATREERFFGFGEKFNSLDQSGKRVRVITFDQPGNKGDRSYKPASWFVSSRGYGFHLDSTAESVFDMSVQQTDRYTVTNEFSTLAFNVVFGPRLTDVLSRYTGLTGRPPLVPPFALGPWMSSDIWHNGGDIRYTINKLRERDIPCSVLVFDSPWERAYNDFQFNIGDGPDVDENTQFGRGGQFEDQQFDGFTSVNDMMSFLQQNGLKAVCWLTPFINDDSDTNESGFPAHPPVIGQLGKSPNFEDGKQRGLFVRSRENGPELRVGWWKGRGSPVDFTNPDARDWLTEQLQELVKQSEVITQNGSPEPAIGGFKPDDGEALTNADSDDTPGGEYIPIAASYADGRTGREMRNGYCVEYLKTLYSVLGENGLIFARSGFTGTQAFPACWSGDNKQDFTDANGLPSVIVAGQSSAMSGYSIWSHDIGGYLNSELSAREKTDVFIRWTQFGCFTPIMQFHRQPIKTNDANLIRHYPWGYPLGAETFDDNAALENYRFYAKLHTQLFPYIYTYAKESATTGLPIIRPLVLLHQDDARTHRINHTYYFGGEFLVAPVIDPTPPGQVTSRNVYLPEGKWIEFWTNQPIAGRQEFNWQDSDQQHLPLFVRSGAMIPLLLNVPDTLCDSNYVNNTDVRTADTGLLFRVYPDDVSTFTLHDGTEIRCQKLGSTIGISLDSTPRSVQLNILSGRPTRVNRGGSELIEHPSPSDFEDAETGWRHDPVSGFAMVKFEHDGTPTDLSLDLA